MHTWKSMYAETLVEIFKGQKNPITFTIEVRFSILLQQVPKITRRKPHVV